MKNQISLIVNGLTLLLLPMVSQAHTGIESLTEMVGWQAILTGILHPLLGLDHLLVMLAIGFWAGLLKGKALWLLPSSFLLMMIIGAGLQLAGIQLAAAEMLVTLSLMACGIGLLLAHRQNLASLIAGLLTSLFAVSHGYVHAAEAIADLPSYASGFLLATAMLHGIGVLLCLLAGNRLQVVRMSFAVVCALVGGVLLVGM